MSFSLDNKLDSDTLKWGGEPEEEQIWEKKMYLILGLGCLFFKEKIKLPVGQFLSMMNKFICLSARLACCC